MRVDLTTGQATEIVSPEPANGGDWALVDDSLYYPTLGEGEGWAELETAEMADPEVLAARGAAFEHLDQLALEHLYGVR